MLNAQKLFVDDIRKEPEGWLRARNVTEAIRLLATIYVDVVSLDHDISQTITGDMPFESFEAVARYIAIMPKEFRPQTVYIHTANPEGADIMISILKPHVEDVIRDLTYGQMWEEGEINES